MRKYKIVKDSIRVEGQRCDIFVIYRRIFNLFWWPTWDYYYSEDAALKRMAKLKNK
jgi:hypothetical protein